MGNRPFVVEFERDGARHRVRYEPRFDGVGWWRFEEQYVHGGWRRLGREVVRNVSTSTSDDVPI